MISFKKSNHVPQSVPLLAFNDSFVSVFQAADSIFVEFSVFYLLLNFLLLFVSYIILQYDYKYGIIMKFIILHAATAMMRIKKLFFFVELCI